MLKKEKDMLGLNQTPCSKPMSNTDLKREVTIGVGHIDTGKIFTIRTLVMPHQMADKMKSMSPKITFTLLQKVAKTIKLVLQCGIKRT